LNFPEFAFIVKALEQHARDIGLAQMPPGRVWCPTPTERDYPNFPTYRKKTVDREKIWE
jgi:hypothetical protein